MKNKIAVGMLILLLSGLGAGQQADSGKKPKAEKRAPSVAAVYEQQLTSLEKEFVSAAEAMPEDKFDFAPNTEGGEFKGVRTFGQQVRHVAAANFAFSGWLTGQKAAVSEADMQNGPANVKTREESLKFLKDSFAAAHKAIASLTDKNLTEMVATGGGRMSRAGLANIILWHSFDHYGQMAVYLRMNGIVPPASRPQQQ